MHMKSKNRICIFFLLLSFSAFAQSDPAFDAMKSRLNGPDDSVKLKTLTSIAYRYEEYNNDSARVYFDKAILLADKLNRKDRVLSLTVSKAETYNLDGNFDSSVQYLQQVALLVSDTVYPKVKGYMLMTYADVYNQTGKFDSAVNMLYSALHIYENLNDSLRMAQVYSSLGRNYTAILDYNRSGELYLRALQIAQKMGNIRAISEATIYLGTNYLSSGKLDSARYYLSAAEKMSLSNPDLESRLITVYGTMGDVESKLDKPELAIAYFKKALAVCEKFNVSSFIPMQNASIAREYLKLKNYPIAKKFIRDAENTLMYANDLQITQIVYKVISEFYFVTGNFEAGETYFDKYTALRDSLLNSNKTEAVAEMEIKYETAKKDRELLKQRLAIADKDNRLIQQRITMFALIAVFIIAVAASVLLYNRYRLKQQTKLDAAIIKEQQLGIKAVIEAQDAERQRISKDLHDGVLQQLAAARAGISVLQMNTGIDEKAKEQVELAGKTIDDAADDLRSISHLMMPRALAEDGLAMALSKLSAGVFKQAGISYTFSDNHFMQTPGNEIALQLYRIVQEIFSNILKHSGATEVDIKMHSQDRLAIIEIIDNGTGFNESEAREKGGAGLFNIYSRIRNINGKFYTESNRPTGSRFIIQCPV